MLKGFSYGELRAIFCKKNKILGMFLANKGVTYSIFFPKLFVILTVAELIPPKN